MQSIGSTTVILYFVESYVDRTVSLCLSVKFFDGGRDQTDSQSFLLPTQQKELRVSLVGDAVIRVESESTLFPMDEEVLIEVCILFSNSK